MLPLVGLEGRVVGEPQMKYLAEGKAVARFRVKCADRRRNNETGKWEDTDVLWVTATAFGKLAENCMESLLDGDQVVMLGKWSTAEWTDQAGNQRSAPRFVCQAVGAGMQFQPRRHSEATIAQRRQASGRPEADASHGYGHRLADSAVAGDPVQSGGTPTGDPWA